MSDESQTNSKGSTTSSPFTLESLRALEKSTRPTTTPISNTPPIGVPIRRTIPKTEDAALILRADRENGPLEKFEDALGGRPTLVDSLAALTLDKKQQHFLALLSDPARQGDRVSKIAKEAGISLSSVVDLFRSAPFATAYAIALAKMASKLPDIVDDITAKSVDARIDCPACFGDGYQTEGVLCPVCNGRGEVFRSSDLDRQKAVLEATGVLKKASGVNVQVNQGVGVMQPNAFFSKFVKASDETAYATEVIDAAPEDPADGTS